MELTAFAALAQRQITTPASPLSEILLINLHNLASRPNPRFAAFTSR
jgi:hypothetical protein